MKRFILKITVFAAISLALLSSLFVLPMDKNVNFSFIKGDCSERGEWIWQKIQLAENANFIFLGSSHTIHALDERVFQDSFFRKNGLRKIALNFGYCRFGNNLPYLFLKEFLKTHRPPEVVVCEIRESEDRFSHPMFGYLADSDDLLANSTVPHPRVFSDWWHAVQVRLENFKVRAGIVLPPEVSDFEDQFGYGKTSAVADPNFLAEIERKIVAAARPRPLRIPNFPKFWLEKTAELARQHGIRLVFLYLPQFGTPPPDAAEPYFQSFPGEVFFPPQTIFSTPANWSDESHLNDRGASELSKWLAGVLF